MSDSPALIAELRQLVAGGNATQVDPRAADAWLGAGPARAQLHEVYAAEAQDGPAAMGFAVALALAAGARPILWVRMEAAERRCGRLHATGLAEWGLAPDDLVLVVVPDETTLLRVAADAARCPGLGAVIMESWGKMPGLNLTATRRLMLAAGASGVTVLSVRAAAAVQPSAAASRWGVVATPSIALAADAPGLPAFVVECLRRRGGPAGARWHVEWNREKRCFDQSFGEALSGAGLPLVADRAAARDAAPPVRRSG